LKEKLSILLIFLVYFSGSGQIVDLNSKHVYRKVFVATDDFDTSYLGTLENAWKKVEIDTIQFSILNDLAYYSHTRNLNRAYDFTLIGLKLTEQKKNKLWNGRFQITQGAILLRMEKLDSALIVLHDATAKVKQKDLPFLFTQLGYVYERKGQLDKATDYAMTSLKLGKKLHDNKAIALAYSDLSNIFWKQSKFKKGLEYGLKSIQIFEENGIMDLDYDFTLYVVGNNHLKLKNFQSAIHFFDQSIAVGEQYGFYNNLSDVYISQVDLYAYLIRYKQAERAGENAIKYAKLLDNNFMLMRSYLSIGKLQVLESKYESAIHSLEKCITIATDRFGDKFYLGQAYNELAKAYAGNHKYKNAYNASIVYDKLNKAIFTSESDQRISLLQTEFEVAQKEITILNQESQITKQKSKQSLLIIIASLLLLIIILLVVTFKNNKKKNILLQKQNEEKEFLLKEIHHRVKNNLGIVSSLLSLQTAQIKDPKVKEEMEKSQNRVYSMSMIHQKLYQGKDITIIEMKDYFKELGNHILNSFDAGDKVQIIYHMGKIELDVDTAVPLGLIVNELLTNAFKYAFPKKINGIITIDMIEIKDQIYELIVSDNGVGHSKQENIQSTGFGTQLITLLTKQLDGVLKKTNKNGTTISITFKSVR